MSDIFRQSTQKPKRTFGDKLFDNFGWVILGMFLFVIIVGTTAGYLLVSHANEIAHDIGGIARSATDGYQKKDSK